MKYIELDSDRMNCESVMPKFMQTLDSEVYDRLATIAKEKGITIQELIRAVIIPEWLERKER